MRKMRLMFMIFHFINAVIYSYSCIWIYYKAGHRRRLRLWRHIQAEFKFTHSSGYSCFNKIRRLAHFNTFAFALHVVVVAYCRKYSKSVSKNEEVIVDVQSVTSWATRQVFIFISVLLSRWMKCVFDIDATADCRIFPLLHCFIILFFYIYLTPDYIKMR